MRIHLRNNPATFHPDSIWNHWALDFFEDVAPNNKKKHKKDEWRYGISIWSKNYRLSKNFCENSSQKNSTLWPSDENTQ